jgi:heme/copper-type cytochrome/quinol oxidase subunit 4
MIAFKKQKVVTDKNRRNLILTTLAILVVVLFIIWLLLKSSSGIAAVPQPACIAATGYQCQNTKINRTSGNLTVTVSQNTGKNWTMVYFLFENTNGECGTQPNNSLFQSSNAEYINSLSSEKWLTITIPAISPNSVEGSTLVGAIWVMYSIQNTTIPKYECIAEVHIKVI